MASETRRGYTLWVVAYVNFSGSLNESLDPATFSTGNAPHYFQRSTERIFCTDSVKKTNEIFNVLFAVC